MDLYSVALLYNIYEFHAWLSQPSYQFLKSGHLKLIITVEIQDYTI